jgi:hypothetical protein
MSIYCPKYTGYSSLEIEVLLNGRGDLCLEALDCTLLRDLFYSGLLLSWLAVRRAASAALGTTGFLMHER